MDGASVTWGSWWSGRPEVLRSGPAQSRDRGRSRVVDRADAGCPG
ncbi:hypothetical protein Sked_33250 [Sanguibacter keddieii DSM 10542]|uniref:Uncharacterized protein n=1 Tax=Sanguibacter keddieii (strain ATCC 51767 / DSM 10542 / NCFB 3025 / ST-74) TaxID=446469 RepID=D1BDZ9_SANKS|nr:hypothetical protein Sked_33250 [Sanguibacter keddieii DSM 10542]